MIDTIKFTTQASLLPRWSDLRTLPSDWQGEEHVKYTSHGDLCSKTIKCERIGLRIHIRADNRVAIDACVPKIIFGHNGRLLSTQKEFDMAMDCLAFFLANILKPRSPDTGIIPGYPQQITSGHFTRIDLPWHFPFESGVCQALADASHGKIRAPASIIRGSTVSLSGSLLEITVYDKLRQMNLQKKSLRPIYRVEFRVKQKALKDVYQFGDGWGYTKLDFHWLQRTMHAIAAEMKCDIQPPGDGTIADFLAHVHQLTPTMRITESYITKRQLSPERARKIRKEVEARLRYQRAPAPFASFFPANGLPPALHIEVPEIENKQGTWLVQQWKEFYGLHAAA